MQVKHKENIGAQNRHNMAQSPIHRGLLINETQVYAEKGKEKDKDRKWKVKMTQADV